MIQTVNNRNIVTDRISGETVSAKIKGRFVESKWNEDFSELVVLSYYFYTDVNGSEVLLSNHTTKFSQSEIDQLAESITPVGSGKCAVEKNLFEQGFKITMSNKYNIPLNEIEIV